MSQASTAFSPHPAHLLWRLLPQVGRRRALAYVTGCLAPRPDKLPQLSTNGLAVGGELSRASGLGEGARLMLRGAEQLGLPVWPLDVRAPVGGHVAEVEVAARATPLPGIPPPGTPLVMHVNGPMLPLAMMRLGRAMLRHRRVVGYWAWELPVVPPDWHAGLPFVHELWVPSAFTAAALEPLLPGRVRVVRPPLAALAQPRSHMDRAAFGLPDDTVIVLVAFNLASSFVRKNPLAAVTAFRAAFGNRRDRMLLVKVINADHFPEDFATLTAAVADLPNVRIETRTMSPGDRLALMNTADIVLTLHRSEGLGLIAAEAMLLGKPVIATGWSGNLDFMDDSSAALVPVRLVPPCDPRGVLQVAGAVWADPDIAVAAAHLHRLADDPAARVALGAGGRRMVQARFGLDTLADGLRGIGVSVP
jgi:glycosyltransferase involved in cell wall biosynthesis